MHGGREIRGTDSSVPVQGIQQEGAPILPAVVVTSDEEPCIQKEMLFV